MRALSCVARCHWERAGADLQLPLRYRGAAAQFGFGSSRAIDRCACERHASSGGCRYAAAHSHGVEGSVERVGADRPETIRLAAQDAQLEALPSPTDWERAG